MPSTKVKKHSHSHKEHDIDPSSASDQYSDQTDDPQPASSRPKKHADKTKHKSRSRYIPSSSEEDQSSLPRHRSPNPSRKTHSDQDQPQHDPDLPYYREVALSDIPSQYAEEVDTFRRILKLPDSRESMPRSSTAVMGLADKKGRQELRPRGPSSMLPLNSIIKYAFDKFDHDFQAANFFFFFFFLFTFKHIKDKYYSKQYDSNNKKDTIQLTYTCIYVCYFYNIFDIIF